MTTASSNKNSKSSCPTILIQQGTKYHLYNDNIPKMAGVNPIEFSNLEEYIKFLDWQRSQGIRCPVLYLQKTYDAQGTPGYTVRPNIKELQGGQQHTFTSKTSESIPRPPLVPPQDLPHQAPSNPKISPRQEESRNSAPVYNNPLISDPLFKTSSFFSPFVSAYHGLSDWFTNLFYSVSTTFVPSDISKSPFYLASMPLVATKGNPFISANPMDSNWGGITYTQKLVDDGYYAGNEITRDI